MTDRDVTVRRTGARLLAGGAGLALAAAALAGCSRDDGARTVSASEITSPPTAAATATAPPATTAATPTPAPTAAVDPTALLQQALDALAPGYHFTTTVTVDGAVTLVADGDRVADGTRLTINGNGGSVAYVITPAGTWALPEGGEWEALDTPPASVDPIAALRTPSAISVNSVEGTATRATATVPPTALGIPGGPDATVQLLFDANALTGISYATTVDGKAAAVDAVIGPLTDPTPVTPPA